VEGCHSRFPCWYSVIARVVPRERSARLTQSSLQPQVKVALLTPWDETRFGREDFSLRLIWVSCGLLRPTNCRELPGIPLLQEQIKHPFLIALWIPHLRRTLEHVLRIPVRKRWLLFDARFFSTSHSGHLSPQRLPSRYPEPHAVPIRLTTAQEKGGDEIYCEAWWERNVKSLCTLSTYEPACPYHR